MNTRNDTGFRTFLVGTGGVSRHTRVKLDTGTIVTAGAGEDAIGSALDTVAAGGYCSVKLFSAPGTHCLVVAGAVALNAKVYGAASGAIDDVATGAPLGTALEAATTAGQAIEIEPTTPADLIAAQAHIADASTAHDLNATFADTEAEAALNALGTKINAILSALETAGILLTA